jgi:hypothetical protein
MNVLGVVGLIAARQHGLITLDQLLGEGVTPAQLRRQIRTGGLVRVRRGVYRLNGVPVTWAQGVLAAVLASGIGAVASHATAGELWALKAVRRDGSVHITSRRQVRLEGVRSHVLTLGADDQRTCHGIGVTSVERTLFDLAATLGVSELGQCVDDALRRRLMSLERLRQLVEQCPQGGRRRVIPVRVLLADRSDGYDPGGSDWERSMDRQWDKLGLPPAVRQHPVTVNGHRFVLDRALPDLKIGVEWNGFATHGTRSAFDYDSDRRADLTAAGWHMVDFTSRSDLARVVAAVRGAIDSRSDGRAATEKPKIT